MQEIICALTSIDSSWQNVESWLEWYLLCTLPGRMNSSILRNTRTVYNYSGLVTAEVVSDACHKGVSLFMAAIIRFTSTMWDAVPAYVQAALIFP